MSDVTTKKRLQKKAEPENANGRENGRAAPQSSPTNDQMGPFYAAGPAVSLNGGVQTKLVVGQPNDPYEQEADAMAQRVTHGGPATAVSSLGKGDLAEPGQAQTEEEEPVQAQTEEEEAVQAQTEEEPAQAQTAEGEPIQAQGKNDGEAGNPATDTAAAAIRNPGTGQPLAPGVRGRIEPHLGADLGGVRVHTNGRAQQAATSLGARAFTHGSNIFLNRHESATDLRLMAHESTHVVQQGAATIRRQPMPEVQLLPGIIMEEINSYARHIPGYTLFTVIIGFNPLTGSRVERSAINLLEGLMGLVPFGTTIFDKLQEYSIIQDAFTWVNGQLNRLDLSMSRIERTLEAAWDDVRLLEGFSYNLQVLRRHFGRLYDDVVEFARTLVDHIIELIKKAAIDLAEGLLAENRAYALIKKIIKYDPLRGETVAATTVEILADFLLLIGKEQELEQMQVRGTLQETADWLDTQFATFMGLLSQLQSLFSAAWDAIQPANLPNLATNLQNLVTQASGFLQQVWDFASTVALQVLELIKNALLSWLSSFAHEVPGFHLVTVLLGRNLFTGEPVPRTAENIIKGFITLLPGGEEKFRQMQETGTIPQAAQRIEGAMSQLGITWEFIVGLFSEIWDAVSINDLIDPIGAFQRIVDRFGEPIARLFAFIRIVVEEIIKLILELMNFPTDIITRIISNAMQAFEDIKRDPVGFLKNMLAAVKLGFGNFFGNILQHLLSGVTDWLFSQLRKAGIEPPADLSLGSVLDLVLQILGVSMERIWEKLAERIGQDNVDRIRGAIDRLVGIWNFVRDVQERGVAAIWAYIQEQISGLWDMLLEQARNWIVTKVIEKVTAKLLSMLDPTGIMAVVNSFIAFFNAVQSAIEYIREILQIVDDYVSTMAAVARGDIEPGAAKMEEGLTNAIPVAIGFLANQVGLGNLAEKIAEIVAGIRSYVDQALDWLLDRAVSTVQSVLRALGVGGEEGEQVTPPDEGVVVHEEFNLGREEHEIKNRANTYELTMSSQTSTLLSQHPSQEVRNAYDAYLQKIQAATSPTGSKNAANQHLPLIIAKIKAHGDPDAPGASAPGVGTVARHSMQQNRLYEGGIEVWKLESEHVIPRGYINAAFLALGVDGVPADGTDYNRMHTVLIYKGAADLKTEGPSGDASLINTYKETICEIAELLLTGPNMNRNQAKNELVNSTLGLLNDFASDAMYATNKTIKEENRVNGAARGPQGSPESPTPDSGKVSEAFSSQRDDVRGMLQARLQDMMTDRNIDPAQTICRQKKM